MALWKLKGRVNSSVSTQPRDMAGERQWTDGREEDDDVRHAQFECTTFQLH